MSCYTQISHTYTRVIEAYKEYLKEAKVAFAKLGVVEFYQYDKPNCEGIQVVYTADNRVVANVKLNNVNVHQIYHIFNGKEFTMPLEGMSDYQTTLGRLMESEEELLETVKRFFEI